jgi:hypothetical protein
VTQHAGVRKILVIHLANLLRQRPDAIAFLEAVLAPGKTGTAKLHIQDGQALAWGFTPGGRRKWN